MPVLCSPCHAQQSLWNTATQLYADDFQNESMNESQCPATESAGAPTPNLSAFPFFHMAFLSRRVSPLLSFSLLCPHCWFV